METGFRLLPGLPVNEEGGFRLLAGLAFGAERDLGGAQPGLRCLPGLPLGPQRPLGFLAKGLGLAPVTPGCFPLLERLHHRDAGFVDRRKDPAGHRIPQAQARLAPLQIQTQRGAVDGDSAALGDRCQGHVPPRFQPEAPEPRREVPARGIELPAFPDPQPRVDGGLGLPSPARLLGTRHHVQREIRGLGLCRQAVGGAPPFVHAQRDEEVGHHSRVPLGLPVLDRQIVREVDVRPLEGQLEVDGESVGDIVNGRQLGGVPETRPAVRVGVLHIGWSRWRGGRCLFGVSSQRHFQDPDDTSTRRS